MQHSFQLLILYINIIPITIVVNGFIYPSVKHGTSSDPYGFYTVYNETLLRWELTVANSLTKSSPSRPSK